MALDRDDDGGSSSGSNSGSDYQWSNTPPEGYNRLAKPSDTSGSSSGSSGSSGGSTPAWSDTPPENYDRIAAPTVNTPSNNDTGSSTPAWSDTPPENYDRIAKQEKQDAPTYTQPQNTIEDKRSYENGILDNTGLKDSYDGTPYQDANGVWYDRSVRTGEYVPISTAPGSGGNVGGPGYIDVNPPSSGVRIINLDTGMSEPGVNVDGEWQPESIINLGGPEPSVSTRTVYNPFQIMATGNDNYGKETSYPAWVLGYDTPIVYEPGGSGYALAIGPTGKKLDPWGGYDPIRGVFVVTSKGHQKTGIDTLGEVMTDEADTIGLNDDLTFYYGSSRLDEFAGRAIGNVSKRTIVDVTQEPTAYKNGMTASYDIGSMNLDDFELGDFKSMKDTVTAKSKASTESNNGVITPAMRLAPPAFATASKSSASELPGYDVFGFHIPVIVPTWMQSGTSIGDALKPVQKPAYDFNKWANSEEISPYIYTAGIAVGMTDNPPGSVEAVDRMLSIVYNKMPGSAAVTRAVNTGSRSADYVINLPGNTIKEYRVNNIVKKLTSEYSDPGIDTVFIRSKAEKIAQDTDPLKALSIRNYQNKEQAEVMRMDAFRYEVAAANRRDSNAMINQEIEQLIQENPDFGYAPRQKNYPGIVEYPNLDDLVEIKTRPATAEEISNYVEYSDRKTAGGFWNYLVSDDRATLGGPALIQRPRSVKVKSEISISGDENYSLFSSTNELDSLTSGVIFPRTTKMNYNVKMNLLPSVSSTLISNTNSKNKLKFNYDSTQWSKQKKDVSEESDVININALKQKSKTKTTTNVITWQGQKTKQTQDTQQTVKTTFKSPTINIRTPRTNTGRPPKAFAFDFGSGSGTSSNFFKVSSGGKKWKNPGFVSDWVGSKPVKKGKGRKRRLF